MKSYIIKNKNEIFVIILFILLPFVFFRDVIHLDKIVFGSEDSIRYYISLRSLLENSIKQSELPFWNPYILNGFPYISSPDIYIFYPLAFILDMILPIVLSYNILILIQYSLGGIFFYFLLKEYNLNMWACVLGGIVFAYSGNMISYRGLAIFSNTVIWFPLVLMFLEKFRKDKKFVNLLLASIFYSFAFFGGFQQIFIYFSIIFFLYIIYFALIDIKNKSYFFLQANIIFVFVIILSLVQLVPTIELVKNSFARSNVSYDFFTLDSFNPKLSLMFFSPYVFGAKNPDPSGIPHFLGWFGLNDSVEMIRYFGISTLPLFFFIFIKKDRKYYFWIMVLIISFILLIGKYNPLYKILYHVPIFNMFRAPARHWAEFGFAYAILIAFGFNNFIEVKNSKFKKVTIANIFLIGFISLGFIVFCLLYKIDFYKKYIDKFFVHAIKVDYLNKSLDIRNFAVYVPIIISFILIFILILTIFKKNKIVYTILIFFVFVDLFLFGHFDEKNKVNIFYNLEKNKVLVNNIDNQSKNKYFRLLTVSDFPKNYFYYPNRNVAIGINYSNGYSPLIIKDYAYIYNIKDPTNYGWFQYTDWESLLKNNVIISLSNIKYIVIPSIPNKEKNINSVFKKPLFKKKDTILSSENLNYYITNRLINLKNIKVSYVNNKEYIFVFEGLDSFIEIPIKIKSDSKYLISFDIKKENIINDELVFDFYSNGYDSPEQQFSLDNYDLDYNYIKITKILKSGNVPKNENILFRIRIKNTGRVSIKDLNIFEVEELESKNNYSIFDIDNNSIILSNDNFVPRFYFVENVVEVKSIQEVKNILWAPQILGEENLFNPQSVALVQNIDFEKKKFQISKSQLKLVDYRNNFIKLKVKTEGDAFLVFVDSYYPGWRAYIDGKEIKIYKTNGIFKGIYIKSGEHNILFKFTPQNFWIFFGVYIFGHLLIIFFIIFLKIKNFYIKK